MRAREAHAKAAADAAVLLAVLVMAVSLTMPAAHASNEPSRQRLAQKADVHTVFLTDCTAYSDWQTLVMVFAWRESGQPGRLSRVMCCTPEERAAYREDMLGLVNTHVAPSFAINSNNGDQYAAYNKPGGVTDWLRHFTPEEEWIVVLDSDMILRRPFLPEDFNLTKGWAVGARYDYLIGVDNALADRHIPEVARRNDTLAGPAGRRADRIGGFLFIHREDLQRVAPLWLKYAEDVRMDPESWHLSGDFYSKRAGDRPWISEMYGYVYGAAKLDIWHHWDEESMIYPGYQPYGVPRILHYGLLWHLDYEGGRWSFDKHWFHNFDMSACPPWDINISRPQHGLFPPPPLPSQLLRNLTKAERYRDLMSIEVVHTLNAALCEHHLKRCPPSDELISTCTAANQAYEDTMRAVRAMDAEMECTDIYMAWCQDWARKGECDKNPAYMHISCRMSCRLCKRSVRMFVKGSNGLAAQLAKVAIANAAQKAALYREDEGSSTPQPLTLAPPPPPPSLGPAILVQEHHQQQQQQEAVHTDSESQKEDADSTSSRKHLVNRCYKMSDLNMHQVKDCVRAAQDGNEWHLHGASTGSAGDKGREPSNSANEGSQPMVKLNDAGGGRSDDGITDKEPSQNVSVHQAASPNRIGMYGAIIAWMGFVGMFLSLLPIIFSRTKRRALLPERAPLISL